MRVAERGSGIGEDPSTNPAISAEQVGTTTHVQVLGKPTNLLGLHGNQDTKGSQSAQQGSPSPKPKTHEKPFSPGRPSLSLSQTLVPRGLGTVIAIPSSP